MLAILFQNKLVNESFKKPLSINRDKDYITRFPVKSAPKHVCECYQQTDFVPLAVFSYLYYVIMMLTLEAIK